MWNKTHETGGARRRKRPAFVARFWAVMGVAMLLVPACRPANEYVEPPPPEVTVARPLQQTVTNYLEETGTTEAVARVEVRARVRGFLEDVLFEEGELVEQGAPLYRIEKTAFEAEYNRLDAAVKVAEADLARAEASYQRSIPLVQQQAMSAEEGEERKADKAVAEANVVAAKAALAAVQVDLDYTSIASPISGRAGKTLVKKGNLVDGNEATHLTTIVDYDPIYANFSISESRLLALLDDVRREESESSEKKLPLYLKRASDKGFPFEGEFDYADLAVDESTGTYLIRGVFPNPDLKILPGLFVRIRIPVAQLKDALLVPRVALGFDQEGRYVFVVDSDNVVQRRNVELGPEYADLQVVSDGLEPDDWVIVRGVQRAREGKPVTPKQTTLPPWQGDGTPGPTGQTAAEPESAADESAADESPADESAADESAADESAAANTESTDSTP